MEIELIGPLDKEKFNTILESLAGHKVKKKERFSIMYFRDEIPPDVFAINDPVDLRIRLTNGDGEIVLKYGEFGSDATRDELSLPFTPEKLGEMIRFLKYLGWTKTVCYLTVKHVVVIDDYELCLVEIPGFGYNFEIEMIKYDSIESAKKRLTQIMDSYGFTKFTDGEFEKQCNDINSVSQFRVDFAKKTDEEFIKEFKEYFPY